jgi:hypothetical protein
MRLCVSRLDRNRRLERRTGTCRVAAVPQGDAECVMRLRSRLARCYARQLGNCLVQSIDAFEQEREIEAGQRVIRRLSEHLANGRDRRVHVLFRLRQDRLGAAPCGHEREHQTASRLAIFGPRRTRGPPYLDRRVERAHTLEGLRQFHLDVGIARRKAGRLPQERQRTVAVATSL